MKILFVFAALCFSFNSYCQHNDYLVKNNGDTIWGNIKLTGKSFYIDGDSTLYISADDVKTINSEKYKGNTVLHCVLLGYVDNLSDMELDYIVKSEIDTVMVLDEIYSTPKMNLYYGTDDFKVPFYFYKTPNDPKPVQLVIRYYLQGGLANYINHRSRYRGEKSQINIAEDKGYVNQLHAIMGNCKNIPEPMWELLSYRDYSFKQLIRRYNKCK